MLQLCEQERRKHARHRVLEQRVCDYQRDQGGLARTGFPDEQIAQLNDEDMETIASAMEDIYCDSGYWEDLELCTNRTLEHKEEDADLDQDEKPTGDEGGLT